MTTIYTVSRCIMCILIQLCFMDLILIDAG